MCNICDKSIIDRHVSTFDTYDEGIQGREGAIMTSPTPSQHQGEPVHQTQQTQTQQTLAQQVQQTQSYTQFSNVNTQNTQRVQELQKQKNRNLILGIVFIWLFWPASIYFFYKFSQIGKELKALGY